MYRRLKGLDKEVEEARVDVEKGRLETDAAKTTGGVNGTRIKSE